MRVSHQFLYSSVMDNIMKNAALMVRSQEQVASGKQIVTPSQDPARASSILALQSRISELNQYQTNISEAEAFLSETESAVTSLNEMVARAKELSLLALNETTSQAGKDAIASEIEQLLGGIGGIANRKFADKYIFAGTNYLAQPFTGPPFVYNGDTGQLNREIAPGIRITVGVDGERVFNMGGATLPGDPDIFTTVQELVTALQTGNHSDIDLGVARLERVEGATLDIQTEIGAKLTIIDRARNDMDETTIRVKSLLSQAQDIDMAEAVMDFQMKTTAYQSSLGVAARMIQPSLLDFLR